MKKIVMIKYGRLLFTASHENVVKDAFLLTLQKFKLIKTTWLSFHFKYCVEGLERQKEYSWLEKAKKSRETLSNLKNEISEKVEIPYHI